MNKNQKAIAQLESCGISAIEENDTVYVCIDDVQLELSEFEINFRAQLYDEDDIKNPMCKKYTDSEVLPDEDGNCSLCGGDCTKQES